ncbi:ABC transporter domain-containing protein [Bordetella tumbae]|uniref:dipeptide ABC transporter ATP-binding protein n=1 Tax=Bordetella tumbae TaxID=1649139 RepID=UPI0039EF3CDE
MSTNSLLKIDGLDVTLPTPGGPLHAVRGMTLSLGRGEALGIVGESGSGKSMTALALMRLLPDGAELRARSIRYREDDLTALSDARFAATVAGRRIAMIFQEPMTSLNPVYTIERQMTELMVRDGSSPSQARERALYLLDRVKVPDPVQRLRSYPHQLSGGQRQRVMIAMALMTEPQLLIADEPTTALDVTVQAQILDLLAELRQDLGMAMILITHDLAVVANAVDRVMVMYGGQPLESGPTRAVLSDPRHPYTRGLLGCTPGKGARGARLNAIPGIVPSLIGPQQGCIFAPRCAYASASCRVADIVPAKRQDDGWYRCLHPRGLDAPQDDRSTASTSSRLPNDERLTSSPVSAAEPTYVLAAQDVVRTFSQRKGLFGQPFTVRAVDHASLVVGRGETLAVVGESGSGKSTLARILLGLDEPDQGRIMLGGHEIGTLSPQARARLVQPVFQDPYSSLNPRRSVGDIVARPLALHGEIGAAQRRTEVIRILERVGLPQRVINSFPGQLSGGQRQRVAIARALILRPQLLLCDEPTSALDVSVQAQILNLLQDLQEEFGLSMLFITHDIGVVRQIADRVVVMRAGRIVEEGAAGTVLTRPSHEYTSLLLDSVPSLERAFAGAAA